MSPNDKKNFKSEDLVVQLKYLNSKVDELSENNKNYEKKISLLNKEILKYQ